MEAKKAKKATHHKAEKHPAAAHIKRHHEKATAAIKKAIGHLEEAKKKY